MSVVSMPLSVPEEIYLACRYFLPRILFWQSQWGDLAIALSDFPKGCTDVSTPEFWEHWMKGWSQLGDRYVAQAETCSYQMGRRQLFRSATSCYHWAEFMYFSDSARKGALRQRVKDCFLKSWDETARPLNRGKMQWNGVEIPYYLLLPDNIDERQPLPCVILSNGLDSVTEVEVITFAEHFVNRGLAAFLFDGPGQGINLGRSPIPVKFEEVVASIVDTLSKNARIDENRLGFFGVSFGGYIALRVAKHLANQFKAVVNLSGGPHLTPFEKMKRRLKEDFQYAFMEPEKTAMPGLFDRLTLDLSGGCETNVLSIHGAMDDIFPVRGIQDLDRKWGDHHRAIVYEQEVHVCLNQINQYIVAIADWMGSWLAPDSAA
ncbi:alpha/beta hydrolase family protein [Nostoc sp.]